MSFERDVQGRIVGVVDPDGKKVKYEYDGKGDLVAVRDREGNSTTFKYEAANNPHFLTEVIDSLGRSGVKTEYDESGRLKQMVDTNGSAVELVYDPDNSIQRVKDVFGKETTYVYDSRGNVLTEIDPLGKRVDRTFDEDNNVLTETVITTETGLNGWTTEWTYDAKGNILSEKDALGNETRYSYNQFGQIQTQTNPLGQTTTYKYDNKGNLLSTDNSIGTTKQTYDRSGNITAIIDAQGRETKFEYDSVGRVTNQIDALGNSTTYTYDASGKTLTETTTLATTNGSQTIIKRWTYDAEGRVTSETDSLGNVIQYEYDRLGNITALIEKGMNDRRTEYRYDAKGQLEQTLYADGTSVRSIYDAASREIATIDQKGQTTHFVYDALDRLTETIYPDNTPSDLSDNPRTKTEYDKIGRIKASIDKRGNRIEYEYDRTGRPILIRDALNNETKYTYNAAGNRLTETDARNQTTKFVYDALGRPAETHFADGTRNITTYDAVGRRSSFTDQTGLTTYFVYDALNRPIEVIHPDNTPNNLSDNPRTKTEYNELGWVSAEIDELGNRQEYDYDLLGRVIESRSSCGCRRKTYIYDEFGNRISETDQLGHTTRFVYDELDRVVETRFADNTYTTTTYDELDRVIATTDQVGKKTEFEYDPQGRLVAVVDALKHRTEYGYDLSGNLISIKDTNGDVTTYEYDELGRRVATVLPDLQRSQTTYDASGNVTSIKDFDKETVTYEYDALNRLTAERFPDGRSVEYTYTPNGLRHTVTESSAGIARTTTYKYDERDRLLWRTEPDGRKIEYTYDAAGNIASVTTPSGRTAYTYDKYNQVTTVTDPDLGVTQYAYDKSGNLTRTEFPNGTIEIREYDSLNRLVFLKNFKVDPGTGQEVTISSYRYTLNAAGQRTKVEENNGRAIEYTYDDLYRLGSEKITDPVAGNRTIGYTYDNVGNRLTCNDSAEGLTTYTYDDNGQLLNETLNGEVTTYSYDDNGNLLSRFKSNTDKASYTWDEENRLIGAVVTDGLGTHNIEYRYDADGVRVASIVDGVETRYLIDTNQPHAQVLEEYTSDGTVRASYTYGLDLVSQERGSDRSFYYVDGLGSTRGLTNASGNVSDTYNYDAYGNLIGAAGSTVNNYLYAGEQYDPNLDDYYLRARYYDSETGRFSARDPFEGILMEPLSLAKYPYVHGNPVNAIDPSGLSSSIMEFSILETMLNALVAQSVPSITSIGIAGVGWIALPIAVVGVLARLHVLAQTFPASVNRWGVPIIVWGGGDLPETTNHIFKALTGSGYTVGNPDGNLLGSTPITPLLSRISPVNARGWYNKEPQCNGRAANMVCDEYPYASTAQGGKANYSVNNVSIHPVINTEQTHGPGNQGVRMRQFYGGAGVGNGGMGDPTSWYVTFAFPWVQTFWVDRGGKRQAF